jgi:hypothetical protein
LGIFFPALAARIRVNVANSSICAEGRVGRMDEHGDTSTVEHLFTTDELTIEIRKARPKVSKSILEARVMEGFRFLSWAKNPGSCSIPSNGPTKKKVC